MHCVNAWLKNVYFNLDLNRVCLNPRTLSDVLLHPITVLLNRLGDILVYSCSGVETMVD